MAGDASRINGKKGGRPRKPRASALPVPGGWPQRADAARDDAFVLTANPFGLTAREERFVAEYLVDGNAARAYRAVHPACSEATSQTNGPATLRKTQVADAVAEAKRQQWLRLQMDGDEALARIANVARADIGDLLPDGDRLKALPPEVRQRIKSVRETKYGRVIELYDAQHANETILKATGRLKDTVNHKFTLEDLVAGFDAAAPPALPGPAPRALPPAGATA